MKIIIDDKIDLIELGYVLDLKDISEMKSFGKDQIIISSYDVNVQNFDLAFSQGQQGIFQSILNKSINIYDDNNILIWEGLITGIDRDYNSYKAVIKTKDIISKVMNTNIQYESTDWETVADVLLNVFSNIGYTNYDLSSFQNAKSYLEKNNHYVKAFIYEKDGMKLLQLLDKAGLYGLGDIYMSKNKIYYSIWLNYENYNYIEIQENDILTQPKITYDLTNIINEYNIDSWTGENTDATSNNIASQSRDLFGTKQLNSVATGSTNQFQYKDDVTAILTGEAYIKRSHHTLTPPTPRQKIMFELRYDLKSYITLNTILKVNFKAESWINKEVEVFNISKNEYNNTLKITGFEV